MAGIGIRGAYEDIRVLILEDNSADAELLEYELKGNGFIFDSKLVSARDDYIEALRNYRPDIILSDYDLPAFSGQEALEIKKKESPETPFILVSGILSEERAIEILTGGATDYVLKRNLSRLLPAVQRALHESYEHRKRREAEEQRDSLLNDLEKIVRERTEALQAEIDDRRSLEEELQQSIHRERKRVLELNAVLDGMTEGLIIADVTGKVLLINQRGAGLLGYADPEEFFKELPRFEENFEYRYPDGRPMPPSEWPLRRVVKGEKLQDFLIHVKRLPAGPEIALSSNGSLITRYSSDKPFFALLTFRDVTERRQSRERTERQKAVLSGIASVLQKALTSKTEEELGRACLAVAEEVTQSGFGFIGEINPRTKKMEVLAASAPGGNDLGVPNQREDGGKASAGIGMRGLSGRVVRDGKPFFKNDLSADPDGIGAPGGRSPVTAFLGVPLRQEGRILGVIALGNRAGGYGPDELESVEALSPVIVQALISKRAEEEARDNQDLLKAIMDGSPDPIFIKDRQSRILFGNPALLRVWGKSPDEVLGKKDSDLYEDPSIAKAVMMNDRLVMKAGKSQVFEEVIQTRDGLRTYLSVKSPRFDSSGTTVGIMGIAHDITQRKAAEREKEKLIADLKTANRELESFSYSVSHDLRAPLRAIEGFSRMLLKEGRKLEEDTKRRVYIIQENAAKMDRLINDLLSFSRSGRVPISRTRIDMGRIMDQLWQEQLSAHPDLKMELRKGKMPKAFGDETLIRQVLSNLLSNAVKFSRRKRPAVIEVGGKIEGKETVFYLKDNGAGFDMKHYDRLFGVFQRLHRESEYEGTGVGLAIVQRIIHRHGGRVWAEGRVGKGATFHFSLPVE